MKYVILVRSRWPWLLFRVWRVRAFFLTACGAEEGEREAYDRFGIENVLTYRNVHVR